MSFLSTMENPRNQFINHLNDFQSIFFRETHKNNHWNVLTKELIAVSVIQQQINCLLILRAEEQTANHIPFIYLL